MTSKPQFDAYEAITEKIITALENGTVPWQQPWQASGSRPMSMSSGKPYRGLNVLLLGMQPYGSPWWGTYRQVGERGGQVRKGEKSTLVTFWKQIKIKDKDNDGQLKTIMMLKVFSVFNAEQADWAEGSKRPADPMRIERTEHERIAAADAIVDDYVQGPNGPALSVQASDAAFYVPLTDQITVPEPSQYASIESYYSTLAHELIHSTGHSTRLARPAHGHFGDQTYSKEELIAEMGAAFLMAEAGITSTIENSAAYIASWLRVLRGDKRLVVAAAGAAQRAADRVLDPEGAAVAAPSASDEPAVDQATAIAA